MVLKLNEIKKISNNNKTLIVINNFIKVYMSAFYDYVYRYENNI